MARYVSMTQELNPGDVVDMHYMSSSYELNLVSEAAHAILLSGIERGEQFSTVVSVDHKCYGYLSARMVNIRRQNPREIDASIIAKSGHIPHHVNDVTFLMSNCLIKISMLSLMMTRILS